MLVWAMSSGRETGVGLLVISCVCGGDGWGKRVLTQEAAEMLGTVGLVGVFASHISSGGFPELDHLGVLGTLETAES